MGVDYGATLAWGVVAEDWDRSVFSDDDCGGYWVDTVDVNDWLVKHGYKHIEYVMAGNFMGSGEDIFNIFALKTSIRSLHWMNDDGLIEFDDPHVSSDEALELARLRQEPFMRQTSSLGWKLTFDIS